MFSYKLIAFVIFILVRIIISHYTVERKDIFAGAILSATHTLD